ncbi:MAG TPA: LPP20 family lipoprotein [Nitrospira sp.]|nr:LPP20 family lipoprotein [Nitrospira sp.]
MTGRYGAALMVCLACCLSGCSWPGGASKPAWVDGVSQEYPPARYLIGMGQSDNQSAAEDQAYAAVARIFKAEVSAQSKDWESYLVVEQRGQGRDERRLTLDNLTKVSTDKVLENVRIADRWFDSKKRLYYSLAVMDRSQAEASFLDRIAELDRSVQADVEEARQPMDKLAKVRALRRAIRELILRETYNADLRVVRASGQGAPPPYAVQDLSQQLEQFLASNFLVAIQVTGDQAEPVQHALSEGLLREGLQIASRQAGSEVSSGSTVPELLIRGAVRVWPIDVRDPQFTYVRWCSDLEVLDLNGQRVLGAISKGGKEGHLSEREATAKVVRIMQQEFSTDVAKAIAAHIYGESELPAEAVRPAGCPREGAGSRPATATH